MSTIREILEEKFGCKMEDIPTDKLMDCLEGGLRQTLAEVRFDDEKVRTSKVSQQKVQSVAEEDFDL